MAPPNQIAPAGSLHGSDLSNKQTRLKNAAKMAIHMKKATKRITMNATGMNRMGKAAMQQVCAAALSPTLLGLRSLRHLPTTGAVHCVRIFGDTGRGAASVRVAERRSRAVSALAPSLSRRCGRRSGRLRAEPAPVSLAAEDWLSPRSTLCAAVAGSPVSARRGQRRAALEVVKRPSAAGAE